RLSRRSFGTSASERTLLYSLVGSVPGSTGSNVTYWVRQKSVSQVRQWREEWGGEGPRPQQEKNGGCRRHPEAVQVVGGPSGVPPGAARRKPGDWRFRPWRVRA